MSETDAVGTISLARPGRAFHSLWTPSVSNWLDTHWLLSHFVSLYQFVSSLPPTSSYQFSNIAFHMDGFNYQVLIVF